MVSIPSMLRDYTLRVSSCMKWTTHLNYNVWHFCLISRPLALPAFHCYEQKALEGLRMWLWHVHYKKHCPGYYYWPAWYILCTVISIAANCGDPLEQPTDHHDIFRSVMALGFSNPALEGNSVNLNCPPGLMLIGPNVSTCMRNGKWEPDPREVACQDENHIIN